MFKRIRRAMGLAAVLVVVLVASTSAQGALSLAAFSVDAGGGVSSGGGFTLAGVIAQPDAGSMSGGGFTLLGGILDYEPSTTSPTQYRVWLPTVRK